MSVTTMLTGMLPFVVLAAALLALPVSIGLLNRYRRSVQRGMSAVAGSSAPVERTTARSAPAASLRIQVLDPSSPDAKASAEPALLAAALQRPWRAAAIYAIAGLAYAGVMTAGWLGSTGDRAVGWNKLLLLSWTYLWPAAIVVSLVAAYDLRRRLQVFGVYFAVLVAVIAVTVARNPESTALQFALYWIIVNGPATVLAFAFLLRPIRAVGPLVLAFMLLVALGSQALLSLAGANESLLRAIVEVGFSVGLGGRAVFIGLIALGVAAGALLAWPLLRALGRGYERRRFSDQALLINALWLEFGIVQSISLAFGGALWVLTGLAAFAAFIATKRLLLPPLARLHAAAEPRRLLLLRVFALGARSRRVFDRLLTHWPYIGNIAMIAGPDLVTTTVEPNEFMEFVSGRLSRQFVSDSNDLRARLARADKGPDPDGRCRVQEFFCRHDTWQMTIERLAAETDAVLMDLRSFTAHNAGCVFELGRLLNAVELRRIVILVDDATDVAFLEKTLEGLWRDLESGSPNQSLEAPRLKVFRANSFSERELHSLLAALLQGPAKGAVRSGVQLKQAGAAAG